MAGSHSEFGVLSLAQSSRSGNGHAHLAVLESGARRAPLPGRGAWGDPGAFTTALPASLSPSELESSWGSWSRPGWGPARTQQRERGVNGLCVGEARVRVQL